MAGKPITQGTAATQFALNKLSKNVLMDVLIMRAKKSLPYGASEHAILTRIQEWVDPFLAKRRLKISKLTTMSAFFERRKRGLPE